MGVASYNRGTKRLAAELDPLTIAASKRAELSALKEEIARLREKNALLERHLARARRCLAAERHGREQLRLRLQQSERAYGSSVTTLCNTLRRYGVPGFVDDVTCRGGMVGL